MTLPQESRFRSQQLTWIRTAIWTRTLAWLALGSLAAADPQDSPVRPPVARPATPSATGSAEPSTATSTPQDVAPSNTTAVPQDVALPTEPHVYRIPEVLVTSSSAQDVIERTPLTNTAARDVISPREVSEAGTLNLQEIFRRSPGIAVSEETGSDSLPNIALRGVTGNDGIFRSVNVSMLVDGIPLAAGPYGAPGASGFPLLRERVYAIDIQRGGAATRYGPNNVSGVINFLTRPIPERTTLETRFAYDSFDDASAYAGLGGTYGRFGFLLEGVRKEGDTYRDHGDYRLENYSLKTSYAHTDNLRSLFQVEYFDDNSDLSDGLSLSQFRADPEQSVSPQNRFAANQKRLNYKLDWQVTSDTRAELITFYYETDRTFYLGNPLFYGNNPNYIQATPRPMSTWGVQPQITHDYEWGAWHGELLAGVRWLREELIRRVVRKNPAGVQTLVSDDGFTYKAASAFVQNEFTSGPWTVTPGLRFESVDIWARNTNDYRTSRDFTEVLPAVSASYLVAPGWSVYSNVQSSFQPPAANTVDLSGNPQDFEAQYAWMYEAGTRVRTEDGLVGADLCVYQIDYSDRLEPDPNQFDVLLNSGRSRHRGVELTLDSDLDAAGLDGFSVWTTAAYNRSRYENGTFEGNDTVGSPNWMLAWGARYEHERSGVFAAIDGSYVGESYSDRENTRDVNAQGTRGLRPSSVVWNAHTGIGTDVTDHCRLQFQVDARNVFDQSYYDVRTGRGIYPGAPFGYGATLGLTFEF